MKKKTMICFLCALLGASAFTGCGNAAQPAETAKSEAAAEAEEEAAEQQEEGSEALQEEADEAAAEMAEEAEEKSEEVQEMAEEAAEAEADAQEEAAEEDEENYETGDASLDDPLNQDEIGEKELLVVSFGTSFNDNRRETIGAIEKSIAEGIPEYSVRRGFTAQIIIDHVMKRDNVKIDNVGEALDRAVDNEVKTLVIQPTHLMNGLEYNDLKEEVAAYADAFEQIAVGEPLLTSDDDFARVADAIVEATAQFDDGETAIVFMGHGTEAESNAVYEKMQGVLSDAGHEHYYVGTVEAAPTLEDVLAKVGEGEYKKVVLRPLMVVAGDHANNDMADPEDPESWYSQFTAAGYEVSCVLEGLGQLPAIRELYVEHAQAAVDSLNG